MLSGCSDRGQNCELRAIRAAHQLLTEELSHSHAESEQNLGGLKAELQAERQLNAKLSGTLSQTKAVLQSVVETRDQLRHKYKTLKKSMSTIVGVDSPEIGVKAEPQLVVGSDYIRST